jgi:hypothetical protein
MNNFKFCYPDANNFNKVIKVKKLEDWKIEQVDLGNGFSYWVAEAPFYNDGFEIFKELVRSFPVQKDNNHPDNRDPNPFDTIHLPEWVVNDVCFLVRDFYIKQFSPQIYDPQIHEWGNLYFKERARPISCWRIPHIDYVHGMVANLWFTDHDIEDSSTKLYNYTGVMHNDVYDFQIDPAHPLHAEWKAIAETPKRLDAWYNPSEDELKHWGFEYIGETPTKAGTMTLYPANLWHNPFVSDAVTVRWSHAFAFSHAEPPVRTMGDILR